MNVEAACVHVANGSGVDCNVALTASGVRVGVVLTAMLH